MSDLLLLDVSDAYLTIGLVFTLYCIIFYFCTGISLFNEPDPERVPFRHKVSYVVVIFFMLPVFYIVFLKEIMALQKQLPEEKKSSS